MAKGDVKPMDAVDLHVAKLFLVDFEQCGIHLDEDKVLLRYFSSQGAENNFMLSVAEESGRT